MDIVDIISVGSDKLLEEYHKIASDLALLGLSEYEARAYIALVAHGMGSADTISTTAQIPRTSVYKALDALEKMGFAHATEGRPRLYRPEEPAKVGRKIIARLEDTFEKLESIKEILREQGMPQLIYTIGGRQKVLDKISELLDTATECIIMSSPNVSVMRPRIEKNVTAALKRGVKITFILPHGQKSFPGADNVRRKRLIATDLIVDSEKALIASPELDVCGFTDNATIAAHLEGFLKIVMEHND